MTIEAGPPPDLPVLITPAFAGETLPQALARLRAGIEGLVSTVRCTKARRWRRRFDVGVEGAGQPTLLNRAANAMPPLFCLHPFLGTVLSYLPIARRLDGLRSVQGLSVRALP